MPIHVSYIIMSAAMASPPGVDALPANSKDAHGRSLMDVYGFEGGPESREMVENTYRSQKVHTEMYDFLGKSKTQKIFPPKSLKND